MADLSSRLRRLLFLVPYVAQRRDGVAIDQLALELEIDRDQLVEDLTLLTQVGPPGGDPGEFLLVSVEEDKVYVDLAQQLTRPLRLTAAEGCSLLLGLQGLKTSGVVPYDAALSSAERKLLRALGTEAGAAATLAEGTVVAGEGATVSAHLRTLLTAAKVHQVVRIEYASASSAKSQERSLEPYGIVQHNGAWYVVGRCQKANAPRTFRVDRIGAIQTLDERFQLPADFDLEAYRRERLFVPSADAIPVRVRFDAVGAARVGQAWPDGEVVPQTDGGAELLLDCDGLEWITGWVLQFGRHAEIVGPAEARSAMRDRVQQIRGIHDSP